MARAVEADDGELAPAELLAKYQPVTVLDARERFRPMAVEPFVDGNPGPHVRAAVDAATAAGAAVDFGPFGSTARVAAESTPELVAAIIRAAFANGATHVTLNVSTEAGCARAE